jgi:hypothetical protein
MDATRFGVLLAGQICAMFVAKRSAPIIISAGRRIATIQAVGSAR